MSKENLKDQIFNAISSIFKNNADEEEKEKKDAVEEEEEEENEDSEGGKKPEKEKEKSNVSEIEVANAAREAERKRIQEIEEIAYSIDDDLVQEAKFGNTACDARELALRSLQREKAKSNQALEKLKSDNQSSKVNNVCSKAAAVDDPSELQTETDIKNAVAEIFRQFNKTKEGK